MKAVITCACGATFSLTGAISKLPRSIQCPNCGAEFPDSRYKEIQDALSTLETVRSYFAEIEMDSKNGHPEKLIRKHGFSIEFIVDHE